MRPVPAALAFLLALVALPAAWSQPGDAGPGPVVLLEDPPNDASVAVAGQPAGATRWAGSDLVSLAAAEQPPDLVFTLKVRDLGTEDTAADPVIYETRFDAKDAKYAIRAFYDPEEGLVGATFCRPEEQDPDFLYCDEELAAAADPAAETVTVRVPLAWLVAADGARLLKGDAVAAFEVSAVPAVANVAQAFSEGNVAADDRMPDDGVGQVAFVLASGPASSGHVQALAAQPARVSNGEATTYLFEVLVRNRGEQADTVRLAAEGTPQGWVVTFPQENVRVDGGEEVTVPVLVTTPFGHQHGLYKAFNVTTSSRIDPTAHAQVELGVRYTRVPQPSGHHDTVYLHESGGQFFFNTLEEGEVPAEEANGLTTNSCGFSGANGKGSGVQYRLMPDLEMGLDVDLDRQGLARLTVRSDVPIAGTASVSGYFVAWDGNQGGFSACASSQPETAILEIPRSDPIELAAGQQATLELPILPLPYGDRIDYTPDLHLGLVLVIWDEGAYDAFPGNVGDLGGLEFVVGSSFQLPLDEYHDDVDEYFQALSGVELFAAGPQQKSVNPGETVVFRLTAGNLGDAARFDLELTGTHLDWARILGDPSITLDAGAQRELAVAVAVPAGTPSGETADVTLHAVKAGDANVRSLVRFLATVDDTTDHPDEAGDVDGLDATLRGRDAPMPAWLLGAALALAAVGRRRQA